VYISSQLQVALVINMTVGCNSTLVRLAVSGMPIL